MNLIIFGPQGSGKGTQAELLSEKYNLAHIETGNIFREISKEDSELGKKVFDIINVKKELIPDDLTTDVIKHYLEKVPAGKGVIIDSAPRTTGQIEPLQNMFEQLERVLDKAIYISLPYEESVKRITKRYRCEQCKVSLILGKDIEHAEDPCPVCGGKVIQREDDTPEGIAKRLDIFYKTTLPAVEYYREKAMLVEVDGNQDREKVFKDVVSKL